MAENLKVTHFQNGDSKEDVSKCLYDIGYVRKDELEVFVLIMYEIQEKGFQKVMELANSMMKNKTE